MKDRMDRAHSPEAYQFRIPDAELMRILCRVDEFPWHEMPDDGGWDYGTNLDYMKELCDYWVNKFDWRAQEERINSFNHFKLKVRGIDMHFICEEGSGENP